MTTIDSPNPQGGGFFGRSVTVADVNGDGRPDLIVGAITENVGTTSQGRVYVFDAVDHSPIHTLTIPGTPICPSEGCRFGQSVSARDLNGDGRADIIAGAHHEMVGGHTVGRAYVFDGATGALIFTLNSPNPHFAADFGISVNSGDINGDGIADIVIGGSGQCVGIAEELICPGQVFVFNGATGDLISTINTPNPQGRGGRIGSEFGSSTATRDVNGDGKAEIFISAHGEDVGEVADQGVVYVFDGATLALIRTLTAPDPVQCGLGMVGCYFGYSINFAAKGWYLVIGSPLEDIDVPDQGRVYVFNAATGALINSVTTPEPEAGCTYECNRIGMSVALSDLNGDGVEDVIAGANAESAGGVRYQGRVHLFDGIDGHHIGVIAPPGPYGSDETLFGTSLAVGDLDMDRSAELIIGAFRRRVGDRVGQGSVFAFSSIRRFFLQ